ncbi:MAG: RsmE family RNA methyltransferase [Chitinophagaceae bacterium]
MEFPLLFVKELANPPDQLVLDENSSRHLRVLRKEEGQHIFLTDGRGVKARSVILKSNKKMTEVRILEKECVPRRKNKLTIAISFTKNASRMEWFLEKITEIGVEEIIPLICERSEREYFKPDRFGHIMEAALIQSEQYWLPQLSSPLNFAQLLSSGGSGQKLIAHCLPGDKTTVGQVLKPGEDVLVAIGPEGDFSPEEIEQAGQHDFCSVSLGATRLRTETAGLVAGTLLRMLLEG